MKQIIRNVQVALRAVFHVLRQPTYFFLFFLIALGITILAIWLPNVSFLRHTITSDVYSTGQKVSILWASLGAFKTNFTVLSRIMTLLVAILSGLNIALFVYYVRSRFRFEKSVGGGLFGTFVGLLGVGCAACGSVVLSSIFGLGATAGFIGVLPIKGAEFGIIGIGLLLWTNYRLARKTQHPLTC